MVFSDRLGGGGFFGSAGASCGVRLKLIFFVFLGLVGSTKFTFRCMLGEPFACNSDIYGGIAYIDAPPDELELVDDAMLLIDVCRGSDVCRSDERKPLLLANAVDPGSVAVCLYAGGCTY